MVGDERRRRILAELEAAGAALDASEIAGRVGLHPNTVRWHLAVLADAGLVGSRPARRATPGRPRIVYELDEIAAIVRLLAEQGFEPAATGREIELRRCPFQDLAEAGSNVVCAAHRGMISRALVELGSNLTVADLEILPRPDACVRRLAPGPA